MGNNGWKDFGQWLRRFRMMAGQISDDGWEDFRRWLDRDFFVAFYCNQLTHHVDDV
jgi:hypothetical protein